MIKINIVRKQKTKINSCKILWIVHQNASQLYGHIIYQYKNNTTFLSKIC